MNTQIELTHIERTTRNAIVVQLRKIGFNVTSIARIMGMSVSSVSRISDNDTDSEVFNIIFKPGE